ncbi:HNH endonuclease [Georgenia faecalis]|uniref:HNH endonuclease n=1 Tax=Georgenia faecalis TaxID=2483799 RepID=UPI000FDA8E39|nr:HNH endonuclease signature motif containing protein [Georgenia faecalis]
MFESVIAEVSRAACGCGWADEPCVAERLAVAEAGAHELALLNSADDAPGEGPEWPEPEQVPGLAEEMLARPLPIDGAPRLDGRPFPGTPPGDGPDLADVLASIPPGLELARILEGIGRPGWARDGFDEYELVEVVAAYRRQEAWCAARAAAAAADLSDQPAMNAWSADSRAGRSDCVRLTASELAPRLGVSWFAAKRLVRSGRALRGALAQTGEVLEAGGIDARKADMIVAALDGQPGEVAWAVEQEVLPRAGLRTHAQLARDLAAALISVDPDEANARHRKARADRRVCHPRPLPDGMASIYAVLPAEDAIAVDLAVETSARAAKADGDPRTLDQLRADALALMGHGALELGYIGPPEAGTAASTSVAAGVSEDPDDGASPAGAGTGRAGSPVPAGARPSGMTRLPRMRLGKIGGRRTQVRVTVPLSVALPPPPSATPTPLLPASPPSPPAPPPSADRGWPAAGGIPDPGTELPSIGARWEVPELEGYGPVSPEVARALMLGGTWQRLVTDPATGAVLDVGRRRYHPPAELAEYVRERDRTCVRPGCSTDARSCELDHTQPWSREGTTAADNLAALCHRDHAMKSLGAFRVRHLGGGAYEWTTPSGHAYRRASDGAVSLLPRRPGPRAWGRPEDHDDGGSARREGEPECRAGSVLATGAARVDVAADDPPPF